jgi:hypothetical protein
MCVRVLPWTDLRPLSSLSDGDSVEIRVDGDGKVLRIHDNHAADARVDPSAIQEHSQ